MKIAKIYEVFLQKWVFFGLFWHTFCYFRKIKNQQKRALKALKYKGLRVLKSGGRYRT